MLDEWFSLAPTLMAGLALGAFYFGGLWLTVQRLRQTRQPTLLALGSMLSRLSVMLLVVYLVTGGQLDKIGVCLLGFFVMRTILVRHWRPQVAPVARGGSGRGTQS
jgi:F1F0 ATPase subunit 2